MNNLTQIYNKYPFLRKIISTLESTFKKSLLH